MKKIRELYDTATGPLFSVELIPPRNGGPITDVYKSVRELADSDPAYYSVTHGSGGSLRGGTIAIAHVIEREYGKPCMAHLTCLESTPKEIENELMNLHYLEVGNILALRGDPPWGAAEFEPPPGGYRYAHQLVEQIVRTNRGLFFLRPNDRQFMKNLPPDAEYKPGEPTDFCIGVAAYPEGHPESPDHSADFEHFVRKIEAGGEFALTQMIYLPGVYADFIGRLEERGIDAPVIPGVFPLTTPGKIKMAEEVFKVQVPEAIKAPVLSEPHKERAEEEGIRQTVELSLALLEAGAAGVHYYSMNNGRLIREILQRLRKRL